MQSRTPKWIRRTFCSVLFAGLFCLNLEANAQEIAMILTENAAAYQKVAAEIQEQMSGQIRSYDMRDSHAGDSSIVEQIEKQKPRLIIALGDKAAELASGKLASHPILVGMVLQLDQAAFQQPNIEGVALHIPPQSVLTQLKLIVPNFKRIGILSGPKFSSFRDSIRTSAGQIGLEVVEIAATDKADLGRRLDQAMPGLDALWLLPDPQVVDSESFRSIVDKAQGAKKALVAYSENFVRAGALFSVSPDYQATGQQLALLAKKILSKESVRPETPYLQKFHYPIGSYSVLNTKTAKAIGLALTQNQLGFIDRIVNGE